MPSTYTPLATTTLGSAATSYTFTSIPSTYTDLIIITNLSSSTNTNPSIRVNGDSGTNYSSTYLTGVSAGASTTRETNTTAGAMSWTGGTMNGAPTVGFINFMNYANTAINKSFISRYSGTGTASLGEATVIMNLWRNTAAITSIEITAISTTFAAGSTFTLYGIKAA